MGREQAGEQIAELVDELRSLLELGFDRFVLDALAAQLLRKKICTDLVVIESTIKFPFEKIQYCTSERDQTTRRESYLQSVVLIVFMAILPL